MVTPVSCDPWIVFPKGNLDTRLRLYCFPYAGRGASAYHLWLRDLPTSIGLCRIQLPGRETRVREQPYNELRSLVKTLAKAIRPYLTIPFAFFGHSLGALMCFELARRLREEDGPVPVHLFVSACRAPQMPRRNPPVYQLADPEFVQELRRRYDGFADAVLQEAELMQLLLPALRADMCMFDTYVYENDRPLDCPISAFGGLQDSQVNQDDLVAWSTQTRSEFKVRMFPGNHFFLDDNRADLLRALAHDLGGGMEDEVLGAPHQYSS